jgi:hypothetical protein
MTDYYTIRFGWLDRVHPLYQTNHKQHAHINPPMVAGHGLRSQYLLRTNLLVAIVGFPPMHLLDVALPSPDSLLYGLPAKSGQIKSRWM